MKWFVWRTKNGHKVEFFSNKRNNYVYRIYSTAVWSCNSLSAILCILSMFILLKFQRTTSIWDRCWHRNGLLSISFEGSFGHLKECLVDTESLHSTCLVKHHVIVFFCPCLSFRSWYTATGFLIKFVAKADEGEWLRVAWASVLVESVPPSTQRVEALRICNVINKRATIGSTIEGVPKWLELFLSCCVPNL